MRPKIPPEIADTAAHCRHYAMCKIDYLGTGSCASGAEKVYVAYYPQGRMDLCLALAEGRISLTPALVDVTVIATCAGRATSNATSSPACGPWP